MTRPAITPNQFTILESLKDGPRWARSFQIAKPLVNDLVAKGLLERCRPHLGRDKNMIRLTAAGCAALEIDPESVPTKREAAPLKLAKTVALGEIKVGVSDRVRSICLSFKAAVGAGTNPREIVRDLAAKFDVQRPQIWRTLRQGGVLPEYAPRKDGGKGRPHGGGVPGYTANRRARSMEIAEAKAIPLAPQVCRDPCHRCGVRGDFGCAHSASLARLVV